MLTRVRVRARLRTHCDVIIAPKSPPPDDVLSAHPFPPTQTMRHLGGCLLLAFLLALAAPAPASGKKAGLLDRLLAAATGAGGHRQALNGLGDMPLEELLQPPAAAFAPREDAWRVDPELRVLSKMMEGDFMGIFQILALDKELERVWSEPRAVAHVLKTMKVFEGVRGVPEIMAKADGDITKEDVRVKLSVCVKPAVHALHPAGPTQTLLYQSNPPSVPQHPPLHTRTRRACSCSGGSGSS